MSSILLYYQATNKTSNSLTYLFASIVNSLQTVVKECKKAHAHKTLYMETVEHKAPASQKTV